MNDSRGKTSYHDRLGSASDRAGALITGEDSDVPKVGGETTNVESGEKQKAITAGGETTYADEKIAEVVTASQIRAYYMSVETGLKEDALCDRVEEDVSRAIEPKL